MRYFNQFIKRNRFMLLLGLALIIGGEFLPMHEAQLWNNVKLYLNMVQLAGLGILAFLVFGYYKQLKTKK